jgi:hypothetical protein
MGHRAADVWWDLAKGHLLLDADVLSHAPPAPAPAAVAAVVASVVGSLESVCAEFARLEALEDRAPVDPNPGVDPSDARTAASQPGHPLWSRASAMLDASLSDDPLLPEAEPRPAGPAPHVAAVTGALRGVSPSGLAPPLVAAAFALHGASSAAHPVPLTVRQAMTLPNYEGPAGWRAATQAEVSRVAGYGVLKVVPASHFYAARRQYGDMVSQGHLVCAFKAKWLTDV